MRNLFKKNQLMITALAIMIAIAGYLQFAGTNLEEDYLNDTNDVNVDSTGVITENLEADGLLDLSEEDLMGLEGDLSTDIESLDSDVDVLMEDYLEEDMELIDGTGEDLSQTAALAGDGSQGTLPEEGVQVSALPEEGTQGENLPGDGSQAALPEEGEIPGEAVFTASDGVTILSEAKLLKEQTRARNKETLLEIINSTGLTEEQKQQAVNDMVAMTDIAEKEAAAEILLEAKGFSDVVVSINDGAADVVVNAVELTEAQRAQIEDIVRRKTEIPAENIVISTVVTQE